MKKISVVIPILNEEENILKIYQNLISFFSKKNFGYEIIFTDNHSNDNSEHIISKICSYDKNIKYIRFRFNIGYDLSVLQGHKYASGDAIITMDCDMQDPLEMIHQFIEKWELGYDLAYGVRENLFESKVLKLLRKLYYKIINTYSYFRYPVDAGEFRIIDKKLNEKFLNGSYSHPYVRGLTFVHSKKPCALKYSRKQRVFGKSKFRFFNAAKYAMNIMLEETNFLQRVIFYLFILTIFIGLLLVLFNFLSIGVIVIYFSILSSLNFFANLINSEYFYKNLLRKKQKNMNFIEKSINI